MTIKGGDRALSQQLTSIIKRAERDASNAYGAKVGIVMVLVPSDVEKPEMQYISNVKRRDGIFMLRKLFERWNTSLEDVPTHAKQ